MSEWVVMPTTKSEEKNEVCSAPYDHDEYKYRIYIPLPAELVKQIQVGEELALELKGVVKRISMSDDEKEGDSGEICLRVKAAKLPSKKDAMEKYAASLADEND